MASFELNDQVRHIYNASWVGKITSIKANGDVAVSWDGNEPLTHPARFIQLDTSDFKAQAGPSCGRASAGTSGGDGRNYKRRKDPSLYGSPQGLPKVLPEEPEEDLKVDEVELPEEETEEVYVREE